MVTVLITLIVINEWCSSFFSGEDWDISSFSFNLSGHVGAWIIDRLSDLLMSFAVNIGAACLTPYAKGVAAQCVPAEGKNKRFLLG